MNKKGVFKIIAVLIALIIIFLIISFYIINKQTGSLEEQQIANQAQQNQETPQIEHNQEPVAQEQTQIPMPTGGVTDGMSGSSAETGAMPSGGGGGSSGDDGTIDEDSSETEEPEIPDDYELPPECVYEKSSKAPECYPELN